MAKAVFKIPTSLNRSFLDHEIALSGGGWQAKPLPMKVLMFWGGSLVVMLWLLTATFLGSGGFLLSFLLVIWWLAATAFFGRLTKTKELTFMRVPALMAYVPRAARRVMTRRSADPSDFASIAGIDAVSPDGLISFADGTIGQAYLVVGTASILVFDEDKLAILDRVDAFWRKVEVGCEFLFITTREPQRIYHQVANLEARNHQLQARDPDLVALMDEQYAALADHVGRGFSSIHQYLVLKADNSDELRRAQNVLRAEVEGSALMLKEATPLDRDEVLQMLRVLYTGADFQPGAVLGARD